MKRKIIFDTDPGVDDAQAIQLILAAPELDLLGLTTIFGNADVDLATINALRLLDLGGRADVPVAKGVANPLNGPYLGAVAFVHGDDGQGNTFRPASTRQPIDLSAAEFIVQQLNAQPGEITLVAVGPLTNLALALQLDPGIVDKVMEVVVMGGNAFCAGNATPAGEANIFNDPDAADLVFGAAWPVTMIGLDVTHNVNLTGKTIDQLATLPGPLNEFVSAAVPFYRAFYEQRNSIDGIYVHDSTVVVYLLAPDLFTFGHYPVRVDVSDGIGRGKTWPLLTEPDAEDNPALRPWQNRPRVKVGIGVEGEKVVEVIVGTLTASADRQREQRLTQRK